MKTLSSLIVRTLLLFTLAGSALAGPSPKESFDQAMQPILKDYLALQDRLAADSNATVKESAARIRKEASALDAAGIKGEHADHYRKIAASLQSSATALEKAPDLAAAREAFKKLSQPMAMWQAMAAPKAVDVVYCPMAKASWLQPRGEIRNPYYGSKMLRCGEVVTPAASANAAAPKGHGDHPHSH